MVSTNPIAVQPRTHDANVRVCHQFALPQMCPISKNPQPGSVLNIWYTPNDCFLEIETLGMYIDSYIGGKTIGARFIRDMEQTIQQIASDCANSVGVPVSVVAALVIADDPTERSNRRKYRVIVKAFPNQGEI